MESRNPSTTTPKVKAPSSPVTDSHRKQGFRSEPFARPPQRASGKDPNHRQWQTKVVRSKNKPIKPSQHKGYEIANACHHHDVHADTNHRAFRAHHHPRTHAICMPAPSERPSEPPPPQQPRAMRPQPSTKEPRSDPHAHSNHREHGPPEPRLGPQNCCASRTTATTTMPQLPTDSSKR